MKKLFFAILSFAIISTSFAERSKIVSAKWLDQHKNDKNIVILDVSPKADYDQGHIADSVNTFAKKTLNEKRNGIANEVRSKAEVQAVLRDLGVNDDSHVIIVWPLDEMKHVYFATRAFWVLENYGVKTSILDGGMKAWIVAKLPTTTDLSKIEKGNITLKNFRFEELALIDDVKKSKLVIDIRPPAYFTGKKKKSFVVKCGTIKGATNLPFTQFLNTDWTFKSAKEIRSLVKTNKISDGTVFFCNTGNLASIGWFATENLGNVKKIKLYDGSMNEWANRKDLPITCQTCETLP